MAVTTWFKVQCLAMEKILSFLPDSLVRFIRLSRPFFLVGGILLYALGVGIADYLGYPIDWTAYWLGQGCVTLLQLSAHYLNEYFDAEADADNPNRTPFTGGSGETGLPRRTALLGAVTTLSIGAAITVLMVRFGYLNSVVVVILLMAFFGSFFYSTPPIRLAGSGYGELTTSILVANLVPAFAFSMQTGDLHRLLGMATFPLTFLHVSMLLAFSLPDYATDMKHGKRTLLVRAGWQKGMLLHNVLLGASYLVLLAGVLQGYPIRLAWPGFLSAPFSAYQIWHMNQIAEGAKPRWTLLAFNGIVIFGATAYFLALAFWTS